MRAEPCTLERLRKLHKDARELVAVFTRMRGDSVILGSLRSVMSDVESAEQHLYKAYYDYAQTIIDDEVQEDACQ